MLVSKHIPEVGAEQVRSVGGRDYEWTWLQLVQDGVTEVWSKGWRYERGVR